MSKIVLDLSKTELKNEPKRNKTLSIRINEDRLKDLNKVAEEKGVSRTTMINAFIEIYLEQEKEVI